MDYGYLRLWKTGPSENVQRAAVLAVGADPAHIVVDDQPPTRRHQPRAGGAGATTVREATIAGLVAGDRLVVACAAVLGNSREDIAKVLRWVADRDALVRDAETGQDIADDARRAALLDRAAEQLARGRTAKAREALAVRGGKRGPPKRPLRRPREELLAMWLNPDEYRPEEVAAAAGVSRRQIYIEFQGVPREPRE